MWPEAVPWPDPDASAVAAGWTSTADARRRRSSGQADQTGLRLRYPPAQAAPAEKPDARGNPDARELPLPRGRPQRPRDSADRRERMADAAPMRGNRGTDWDG